MALGPGARLGIEERALTDDQKAEIGEVRRVYKARIAQEEVMFESKLRSTMDPGERETLQLLAEGKSAKEIAAALGLSSRTVEFHKYAMMETLGIENSAELIRFAIKHGIAS